MGVHVFLQQFQMFFDVKVAQIQFIDRVLACSCTTETCTHSASCAADRRNSPGAALGLVLDMPIVVHRQMRGRRTSDQKCVQQRQAPRGKLWKKFHNCSFGTISSTAGHFDKAVDVPVISRPVSSSNSSLTSGFNLDEPTQPFSDKLRDVITMMKVWVMTTTS